MDESFLAEQAKFLLVKLTLTCYADVFN